MTDRRLDILLRILSRSSYDAETGCLIWQGPTSGDKGRGSGYARMCLNGATVAVHRVMWTNHHGYIPPRKHIDHKCANRLCVNPEHLQMVTQSKNEKLKAARKNRTKQA